LVKSQPEIVAHHCNEAGLAEHAVNYWQKAGESALARSANAEAVSHVSRALELLKTLPDGSDRIREELALQLILGPALVASKGWAAPDAGQAYTQARELCRQLGESAQVFPALFGMWAFHLVRGEHETNYELAQQLLTSAQSARNPNLLLEAHAALANSLSWFGEFNRALEHSEQAIRLYDFERHRSHALVYGQDPGVMSLSFGARHLWILGYPDQALRMSERSLTLAQKLSHAFSLGWALMFIASFHQLRREPEFALSRAEEGLKLAHEQQFPYFIRWGAMIRGLALAEQGSGQQGLAEIQSGLAGRISPHVAVPWHLGSLAEAHRTLGQSTEGLRALAAAFSNADATHDRFFEAELHRLQGELLLIGERPDIRRAEYCYREAIEISRRQKAKSWELRATMSLARLLDKQGRRDEARAMLTEIYNWFTEGFDTADLKDAKALLDELSA
jgi:predicted ATPase